MSKKLLLILWCAVLSPLAAAELRPERTILSIYKDVHYHINVTHAQLDATPVWPLSMEYPPLAPRKAVALATAALAKKFEEAKDWKLRAIYLEPSSVQDKWLYVVEFDPTPRGTMGKRWMLFSVVVLMNGSIPDIQEVRASGRSKE